MRADLHAWRWILSFGWALWVCACSERTAAPDAIDAGDSGTSVIDAGAIDASPDPDACAGARSCGGDGPTKLDLLFVIDNSGSMKEEQESLSELVPGLMNRLTRDVRLSDGSPLADIHAGVVTMDIGVGGFDVTTCAGLGDDGVLKPAGDDTLPVCDGVTHDDSPYVTIESGAEVGDASAEVACLIHQGLGGCGFEQPLEAVLKAVTTSSCEESYCEFQDGQGHADGANAGFLRDDSVLAIVLLTDEEDCSAANSELFNMETELYPGNMNLRCFEHPEALHPIERYVDGLLAARRYPAELVFIPVAGVPGGTTGDSGSDDFDALLAHPDMVQRVDDGAGMGNRLVPSCNIPGRGVAFPPRRLIEVARSLAARGAKARAVSLCTADFAPVTVAIAELVGASLSDS